MKKLISGIFFICAFFQLFSCNNTDDINDRLSYLESRDKNDMPRLESVSFLASENPLLLISDITCDVIGDSVVSCLIPHLMSSKELQPVMRYNGDSVYVNGQLFEGGIIDCKKPVDICVFKGHLVQIYKMYIHSFTGLPVMWIETKDREDVLAKDYQSATVKLNENVVTRGAGDNVEGTARIKCRGNSSFYLTDKKSYTLKFDEKVSLFDWPKDKSYVLLANSFDKTMLRNYLAYYMGKMSLMEYSPNSHFVDIVLNGKYHGTYLLVEQLKISKDRVNVGDDGFLLEVDQRAVQEDEPYFRTEKLPQPVNIKDPDVVVGDENYNYIMSYVQSAEKVLFSEYFTDPSEGWQKYLDIESFADWYLIEEIAKNGDARMYTSCYMNLARGGKLKMGPVWDFDVTFGNDKDDYATSGFVVNESLWMQRLFQDPIFRNKIKERFTFFYSHKEDFFTMINGMARYLAYSVKENEDVWHVLHEVNFRTYDVWGTYQNEVSWLKLWLDERLDWIKNEYEYMQ